MRLHNVLLTLLLLGSLLPLNAQSVAGLGAISGLVTDPSGAPVPNAKVVVANESKGIQRQIDTNQAGLFSVVSLVPSDAYSVVVTRDGFAKYEAKSITIQVGQVVNFRIPLHLAASSTQIEVVAAAPMVDSNKTGVSQVVTSSQIVNLPINGRRVDSFVLLTPGVTSDGTFGLVSFRGIPGGNAFLTDGNDTTNQYYNENAGRTRISAQISQDAVQEFQVLTSGYSAEFGRASGGTVNTVTRSGSNDVHGTGYWFYRDQNFNARDRYASFNPDERRNQFGGSIGGPIIKNKTFYFFNTEITRRSFPLISSHTNAPLFNSNGDFVAACTATVAQCAAARVYVDHFKTTLDRTANQELLFGKIDHRVNDRHSLSASFNYLRWISPNGIQTSAVQNNGSAFGSNGNSEVRTRYGRLAWTALASQNKVNEFRFGWFKDRLFDALSPELNAPGAVFLGSLTVDGVSNLGTPNYMPRVQPTEDRFQFADNFSWTAGKHLLKFGVDVAQTRDIQDQLLNSRGTYSYPNFTAFAQDFSDNSSGAKRWQSYSQRFGAPLSKVWINDYNFFVQDQYRATQHLTLNYGLRYEFATFTQPTQADPNYPLTGSIPEPKKNFAPRLGVAYSFNNDKTVLRAGWGMFYARFPGALITSLDTLNFQQRDLNLQGNVASSLALGPVWPNVLGSTLPSGGASSLSFAGDNFRTPYTMQGDFGIDQSLSRNVSMTVSYLWNRGLRMINIRDQNLGALGAPVTYQIFDIAGANVGSYTTSTYQLANRVDPRYQRINVVESGGNIWYHGMTVQVRNRNLRFGGLMIDGTLAYTWSHAIDENLGNAGSNLFFSGGPSTLYNGNYRLEKGSSVLDQRHRLTFGQVFQWRPTNRTDAVSKFLINDWQLSLLGTFATPQPTTPTVTVSGSPFTGAAFNNTLNGSGGDNRVPFLPRNSLDIDSVARMDARISKPFPITERVSLTFNFEGFNVFNNVSDTSKRNGLYRLSGGQLRPLANYGEGTQSSGFPDGTNARRLQLSLRLTF